MAFINEYISKEDIEKYGLRDLIHRYKKYSDRWKRYTAVPDLDRKPYWAIDRDRDIWLMCRFK